jgi:multiple sugar transport system substrate-binding protein
MLTAWTKRASLALALTLVAQAATAQTVRVWSFLDPVSGKDPREKVLKILIDRFEAQNPGVKIVVEPQVWQQMSDKFFAAHQTGTAPDIIWVHSSKLESAVKLGALANFNDLFLKNWSKQDIADVDGVFWRHGASANAHYQFFHSRSTAGQFYRIDWFKEAGIDPNSLTTWDKFIAAAQKLTVKDASGNVTRWGYGMGFATEAAFNPVVFAVILDKDKKAFDDKGRAVWATPAGIEGMNLQVDMIRKHKITPDTAVSMRSDDLYDQFNAGRMAIVRGSAARIPRAMAALGAEKVGYLPTPSFTEGKASPTEVLGWCIAVWSKSPNKEMAGKFVEYMSSKEADTMWVMQGGVVPIRKSTVTDNPAYFADPKNAYLVTIAKEMTEAGWIAPEGVGAGWNEELNRAAQDVLTNNTDPKAALQKAEAAFNRANRR